MNERIRGNAWKINWHAWSKETFEKAKNENKLILLSLAGVWCHWCHVMDETTYSDEEIIKLINENFIPVRVDVDERPDISERYNFGGYPTFAFLTHEGDVITGGTYVPPQQFKEILKEVIELSKKMDLKDLVAQTISRKRELAKSNPNEKIIWEVVDILISYFDESYGGFGIEPKFPLPDVISFVANMYSLTGKEGFRVMLKKTLDGIDDGLFDRVEGGFFRYSVTRDWRTPHYEKMLEMNANLLKSYAFAFYLLKDETYKEIAEKTAEYLLNTLRDPELSLFYSSQDADEHYYALSLEERRKRSPPYIDKKIYSCKNALCADAFFKAGLCLNREDFIELSKHVFDKLYNDFLTDEGILHSKESGKSFLDDNLHMLALALDLYSYYLEKSYLEKAIKLGDLIIKNFREESGLLMDRRSGEDSIGLLKEAYHPIADNAMAVKLLYILGELVGREDFKNNAFEIASILSHNYSNYSIFATSFADSLIFLLNPIQVKLVFGDVGKARKIAAELKLPLYQQVYVDFKGPGEEYREEGIYVCKGTICYPPLKNPVEALELINKISSLSKI